MLLTALHTERLTIRPFRREDAEEVHAYMADPAVVEHLPEEAFSRRDTDRFIAEQMSDKGTSFAMECRRRSVLVGHFIFHKWFADRTYEIGWVVRGCQQNKGYATEAARSIVDYGFAERKAHRIIATCQPENTPSKRVMEKLGMRCEGHFLECIYRDGRWVDELFYALLRSEWQQA